MYYLEPDARKICLIKISIDILIFVAEKYNRVTVTEFHT